MSLLTRIEAHYEATATPSVMHLQAEARRMLSRYFHDFDVPDPKIKIVNSVRANFNGRCIYKFADPETSTIEIQKAVLSDEPTMRKVLLHELIHHVDYMVNRRVRGGPKIDGHGKFFQDLARRINAIEGQDFVTKVSDSSYVVTQEKEYYLAIDGSQAPKFTFQTTYRLTTEIKERWAREINRGADIIVIRSKDARWASSLSNRFWKIPRDKNEQEILRDLWQQNQSKKAA